MFSGSDKVDADRQSPYPPRSKQVNQPIVPSLKGDNIMSKDVRTRCMQSKANGKLSTKRSDRFDVVPASYFTGLADKDPPRLINVQHRCVSTGLTAQSNKTTPIWLPFFKSHSSGLQAYDRHQRALRVQQVRHRYSLRALRQRAQSGMETTPDPIPITRRRSLYSPVQPPGKRYVDIFGEPFTNYCISPFPFTSRTSTEEDTMKSPRIITKSSIPEHSNGAYAPTSTGDNGTQSFMVSKIQTPQYYPNENSKTNEEMSMNDRNFEFRISELSYEPDAFDIKTDYSSEKVYMLYDIILWAFVMNLESEHYLGSSGFVGNGFASTEMLVNRFADPAYLVKSVLIFLPLQSQAERIVSTKEIHVALSCAVVSTCSPETNERESERRKLLVIVPVSSPFETAAHDPDVLNVTTGISVVQDHQK